jgi:oligopeptide/dipeptide ABC transporter ATP-binding protein
MTSRQRDEPWENPGAGEDRTHTPILSVRSLEVHFTSDAGELNAVRGVSFDLFEGELMAVVGETGSGKSVTLLAIVGLLAPNGRVVRGTAEYLGKDLVVMTAKQRRAILGSGIALVFQDAVTALNPVHTVGWQIVEGLRAHNRSLSKRAARVRAVELLRRVGVSQPEIRVDQYPHELSGGTCQRVSIAMAISSNPRVLIADEPTTALDVTVQAQILELLQFAQRETGAATILVTHDLGVVAEVADQVAVMYAGRVVESASVAEVFHRPTHPYTRALLDSRPRLGDAVDQLPAIPGSPPRLGDRWAGCAFASRCNNKHKDEVCLTTRPRLLPVPGLEGHRSACHFRELLATESEAS